jgi:hypothetical protein
MYVAIQIQGESSGKQGQVMEREMTWREFKTSVFYETAKQRWVANKKK